MDIEHLSKSQIVLLTLLVSFVTSIATGIVTVSLMDQAPPVIAQTVNRVIEHTIETVVASSTPVKSQAAASVVTHEKTVVVNESELISGAVVKIEPSVVHLYTTREENPVLLGIGVIIDGAGIIVTDADAMGERSDVSVALPDGTRVRGFVIRRDADNGMVFIQGATTTATKAVSYAPARIAASQAVLGQSVVAISGRTTTRIAPGVITALVPVGGGRIIDTNISADAILDGSPLINSEGSLVGVSTSASRTSSLQGFVPATVLLTPPAAKK